VKTGGKIAAAAGGDLLSGSLARCLKLWNSWLAKDQKLRGYCLAEGGGE